MRLMGQLHSLTLYALCCIVEQQQTQLGKQSEERETCCSTNARDQLTVKKTDNET